MNEQLKPCPFCGGNAELDTEQVYRAISDGKIGTRIVAYCTKCDADMGRCREDVPDLRVEEIVEVWNARVPHPTDALRAALEDAYRYITQPTAVYRDRGNSMLATHRRTSEEFNALTSRIRAALQQGGG